MYVHYLIVFAIYITLIGSYSYIASDISLSDAVQEGVSALDSVSGMGWACFTIFWILSIIYFWRSFISGIKSMGSGIKFVFTGMKVDPTWETVFNTPEWAKAQSNNSEDEGDSTPLNVQITSDPGVAAASSTDQLV